MLHLEPVPILGDNYAWLLSPPDADRAVVVDPGEAAPVLAVLEARGLGVEAVLITHHHGDHVGGLAGIIDRFPATVYGPAAERIDGVDRPVSEGDGLRLFDGSVELTVVEVPGHTLGHVAYLGHGVALVGDTLFAGGCGRVFEGTPQQMHRSLERLAKLADGTLVVCAHEYTVANLEFAVRVEPDNSELEARLTWARRRRAARRPTVPSTIADELGTNPFVRCERPTVVAAARRVAGREVEPGADAFAIIRAWKDRA